MRRRKSINVAVSKLGRAVFARRPFTSSMRIGRVIGEIVCGAEYGSNYCMEFGDGRVLEPKPPFRYLNHSCEPNCELVIWEYEDPADWEIHVYATRRIKPGEELTIDYAWSGESAIPCACGSESCRGWIVSSDEIPRVESTAEAAS